jgi:hypothetical protein
MNTFIIPSFFNDVLDSTTDDSGQTSIERNKNSRMISRNKNMKVEFLLIILGLCKDEMLKVLLNSDIENNKINVALKDLENIYKLLKRKEYDQIDENVVCNIFEFYGLTEENGWDVLEHEDDIFEQDDDMTSADRCICTHPIKELCYLFFKPLNINILVGNKCVSKVNSILGTKSEKLIIRKRDQQEKKRKGNPLCHNGCGMRVTDKRNFVEFDDSEYKVCQNCMTEIKEHRKLHSKPFEKIKNEAIKKSILLEQESFFDEYKDQKCTINEFKGRGYTNEKAWIKDKFFFFNEYISDVNKKRKHDNFVFHAKNSLLNNNGLVFNTNNCEHLKCQYSHCFNFIKDTNVHYDNKIFCDENCLEQYQYANEKTCKYKFNSQSDYNIVLKNLLSNYRCKCNKHKDSFFNKFCNYHHLESLQSKKKFYRRLFYKVPPKVRKELRTDTLYNKIFISSSWDPMIKHWHIENIKKNSGVLELIGECLNNKIFEIDVEYTKNQIKQSKNYEHLTNSDLEIELKIIGSLPFEIQKHLINKMIIEHPKYEYVISKNIEDGCFDTNLEEYIESKLGIRIEYI